jgi:cytochrome c
MKSFCMVMMVALFVAAPLSLYSQETGAGLFASKCAMCHGEKGEGKKVPMNAPALKGTKMTAEKLVEFLIKGEKGKGFHENPVGDLNADKAKLVADFIKAMK